MEHLSAAKATEVFLELRGMDEVEDNRTETFAAQGCSCSFTFVPLKMESKETSQTSSIAQNFL